MKTIFETIKDCKVGQVITDGVRSWETVEDGEVVIAAPLKNWDTAWGDRFELWGDAQSKISVIPDLKVID